jgi:hypothetical protein
MTTTTQDRISQLETEMDSFEKTVYIGAEEQYTPDVHGLWFNLEYNSDRGFYDYFITLAEWRDKQINSILDGE